MEAAVDSAAEKTPAADLARKRRWFRAYEDNKKDELDEARLARQYYHDKQWTEAEIRKLRRRGQQDTVRNRIKRKVDFLVGIEQRLRRDPKAFPRTPQHERDADTATASLRYVCDRNLWPKIASDCMHDGLVSGIGVVHIGISGEDPSLMEVPVDRFFYDPRSIKPDFSDARYLGLHLWLDTDEAKEKWPDKGAILEKLMDANGAEAATAVLEQDRDVQWSDFEHRRVRVIEFWEKRAWTGALASSSALTPSRSLPSTGWYYCYFTGDIELERGWSPYRGLEGEPDCPYEAWSPYVDEKGVRYGLVRTLRSVQDEVNYSASKLLHRLSTRQFWYKRGAVEDVDALAQELARPDGKIEIAEHAKWGEDIGPIDDAMRLQGEAERHQMAIMEMENYGPNPGLTGQGTGVDGASGRALLAQRDSGMTELSPIFERHRDWKLRCYRKMWARCRQAWTAERWIRVTDDEDAVRFVPLNAYQMDPVTGRIMAQNIVAEIDVDIMLDEGPDTVTMNEELLQTLSQLSSTPPPLWKVFIELSNTPQKEKLMQMLDEAQQAMQPPPDPGLELKAKELEQRAQETQIKGQIEMQKGQLALEKADKDLQLADRNLVLKDMEIRQRQLEFEGNRALKMIEIDYDRERHAREMEAIDRKGAQDAALFEQKKAAAKTAEARPDGR
jgi:hypothetical protein